MSSDHLPWQLLLQVILIFLNAIFASAEIAVITLNENMLRKKAEEGNKRASRLIKLTSEPAKFLATIQIGITLAGFLGSAFAADNFSELLVDWLISLGVPIPVSVLDALSVIVITIILSYFTLIFGELVPKRIAMKKAESLAMLLANFIYVLSKITAPIVAFLTFSTNSVLRLFRINPEDEEEPVTEEEIRTMVDIGGEKGTIAPQERTMINNIFEFDTKSAQDIMTHRTAVRVLRQDESLEKWEAEILDCHHSRFPVCRDNIDHVLGTISVRGFYAALRAGVKTPAEITPYIRPVYLVPETVKIDLLLRNMQRDKQSFAVVVDEYGGVSGILTISDILEEIVGQMDLDNPTADQSDCILLEDASTWKISGTAPLDEVAEKLGVSFPEDADYDTFGGCIVDQLGYIPEQGKEPEAFDAFGLTIKVLQANGRRVEWARVCKSAN
ncbi:MAG TPA: hemolysin family protein [Firmicutes bacterium]|nr:hemolysin family protein [Bacillota bacterium]